MGQNEIWSQHWVQSVVTVAHGDDRTFFSVYAQYCFRSWYSLCTPYYSQSRCSLCTVLLSVSVQFMHTVLLSVSVQFIHTVLFSVSVQFMHAVLFSVLVQFMHTVLLSVSVSVQFMHTVLFSVSIEFMHTVSHCFLFPVAGVYWWTLPFASSAHHYVISGTDWLLLHNQWIWLWLWSFMLLMDLPFFGSSAHCYVINGTDWLLLHNQWIWLAMVIMLSVDFASGSSHYRLAYFFIFLMQQLWILLENVWTIDNPLCSLWVVYFSYATADSGAQDSVSGFQPAEVQDAHGCSGADWGPRTPRWSTTKVCPLLSCRMQWGRTDALSEGWVSTDLFGG